MWIKLHLYLSGDEVAVQTQNICVVYPDQRKQYKGMTGILLIGGGRELHPSQRNG